VCACECARLCACECARLCECVCAYAYVCTCVSEHINMHTSVWERVCESKCVRVRVRIVYVFHACVFLYSELWGRSRQKIDAGKIFAS